MSEPLSFLDGRVVLHAGDCREVLRNIADNSVDSVVTDPPYHLQSIVKRFGGKKVAPARHGTDGAFKRASAGFMSKTWDGGDIAFQPELWAEVLRVLKPGGYIMAFSGCRTYHRMACAIEDAGFITHPFFAWCFGSGFPKAHSVSKQIDREANIKGSSGEYKSNRHSIARHYQDGMERRSHSDKLAIESNGREYLPAADASREWDGWFYGTQSLKPALEPIYFGQKPFSEKTGAANILRWGTGGINVAVCKIPSSDLAEYRTRHGGGIKGNGSSYELPDSHGELGPARWPANLIHDGSEEVLACFPESKSWEFYNNKTGRSLSDSDGDRRVYGSGLRGSGFVYSGDAGSAARFFASFPQDDVQRIFYTSKADSDDRLGSRHPTVKPLDLIQYLVRLITPKNGVCLDLFAGTGTTAQACFREGFRSILIEREQEYIKDIERRMSLVMEGPVTRANAGTKARGRPADNGPLFRRLIP